MQALVRIALSRLYTFVVLALLILLVGPLAAWRTPTDIFPYINIPVIRADPAASAVGQGPDRGQPRRPRDELAAHTPGDRGRLGDPVSALQARGLTGQDVASALAAQNVLTPVGSQKIGGFEYAVNLNNAPSDLRDIAGLPVKAVNGVTYPIVMQTPQ